MHANRYSLIAFLLPLLCRTAPLQLGVQFERRDGELPTLTLPYGTWRAASWDANGDIYTFKNIRFAAPPLGDLRWAKPAPPEPVTEIQDGSYGPICRQSPLKGIKLTGKGADSPFGQAINQALGGIPIPTLKQVDEDCLFLDIRVPGKAIRDPSIKLPVVNWIYGGAFTFGAKDQFSDLLPLYNGKGVVRGSGGNMIFVSSNYRVGAFGFLAGDTMEKEGIPNAGLWDQRAVLQWIQDHIHLVGGDKTQVSAWGESAGAGSILHHLTAFGGTQDPLFTRAIVMSPAYEPLFDRKGAIEGTFRDFATLAGCAGKGLACLRAADSDTLDRANFRLSIAGPSGTFAVGPTPDGSFVRQNPTLEFASGNYWKALDSIIISHVTNEAELFIPRDINDDAGFSGLVDFSFPAYAKAAGIDNAIIQRYPSPTTPGSPYSDVGARLRAYVGDQAFYCNARVLTDAYAGKAYDMVYAVGPGLHATDLVPLFYDLSVDVGVLGLTFPLVPGIGGLAAAYQSYFISHARTGDPNRYRKKLNIPWTVEWGVVDNGGEFAEGVLRVGSLKFGTIRDEQTGKGTCRFWKDVLAASTKLGGYVPANGAVQIDNLPGVKLG